MRYGITLPVMITFLALLLVGEVHAQDSLFYYNGSIVVGQVEEIGIDQVRYRTNSAGNQVLVVVEKQELSRIKLKGGQDYAFDPSLGDGGASREFLARKHAISIDALAPALDHITVCYQHVLGRRVSLSLRAGYIGLWDRNEYNDTFNSQGGLFVGGVTFKLPYTSKPSRSGRDAHPLSGWYLRPEIAFSAWTRTWYSYPYWDPYGGYPDPDEFKEDYTSAAFMLSIGRQTFLSEHLTFDFSGGLGYGAQWRDGKETNAGHTSEDRQEYSFSHAFFGESTPLVVNGGVRFGYVF